MAAAIRERYPSAEITMNPSGGGRFEVSLDGVPIFEKSKLGRHAQPGEILRLVESAPGR
ncbi:MAG: Rdx family protein [Gemmatimonadaceae bacterium]